MVSLAMMVELYVSSFPAGYGPLSDGVPDSDGLPEAINDIATERTQPYRKAKK